MTSKEQDFTDPIWQLKENRKGMNAYLKTLVADKERLESKISELLEKMDKYDAAIEKLVGNREK